MHPRQILPLLTAFLLAPGTVEAQNGLVHWSEAITVHSGTQDLIRPRVVVNGDGAPVVLWGQASSAANHAAVGEGEAFSAPVMVHPATVQTAVADWQGSDIAASGDQVYVVLKRIPENTGGVYLISSSDGGYTWSDTLRVDDVPGFKTRFSSVAINEAGEPLVQYMRIDMQETDHRYMVSRVVDGVVQPPVDVSSPFTAGDDCDCCPGQVVANGNDVVALYRDASANLRVIWGAASNDGGATFPVGAQVDHTNWTLNSCPASGPDGVVMGDSIRYTWMSAAVAGSKVYVGAAHLQDLSTGTQTQVHPGQPQSVQQNHPRIAGTNDTTGVVWQQTSSGQTEVLFAFRTATMAGFSPPDTVNVELQGAQRSPDVTYANGRFHIVWADYQTNSIMYRTATLVGSIGINERTAIPELQVWPVPATDRLHIKWSEAMIGGRIEIRDVQGRVVLDQTASSTIGTGALGHGLYSLVMKDRQGATIGRTTIMIASDQ